MFVGLQQVIELRVDGGGAAPRGRWEERLDTLGIGGALVSSTCSEQMCREHPSIPHIEKYPHDHHDDHEVRGRGAADRRRGKLPR